MENNYGYPDGFPSGRQDVPDYRQDTYSPPPEEMKEGAGNCYGTGAENAYPPPPPGTFSGIPQGVYTPSGGTGSPGSVYYADNYNRKSPKRGMPAGAAVGIIAAAVILLGAGGFFLFSKFAGKMENGFDTEKEVYETVFEAVNESDADMLRSCFPDEDRLSENSAESLDGLCDDLIDETADVEIDTGTIEVIEETEIGKKDFKDTYNISMEGKETEVYVEFTQTVGDETYRASQVFTFVVGEYGDKWLAFEINADSSTVQLISDGEDVSPENPGYGEDAGSTESNAESSYGENEFARYETDGTGGIFSYPLTDGVTENTVIPVVNTDFGTIFTQCHNILEDGNYFDETLFTDYFCSLMYDYGDYTEDDVLTLLTITASFADEFSDYGMRVSMTEFPEDADILMKLYVSSEGGDDVIWIMTDLTVYLNDGTGEYSSGMFSDDTLAVWYTAMENAVNGDVFIPGNTEESTEGGQVIQGNTDTGLPADLYSEQFMLDGTVYHLPFDYSLISSVYSFDPYDYSDTGEYILSAGSKTTGTVDLVNSSADEDFTFWAGFVNDTATDKNMADCPIWSVTFDISWCDTTDYPSVVLPGNITWGSTLNDVVSAYGEPSDTYRSDSLGYWVYTYEDSDYDYVVELTVYDDGGVKEIDLSSYESD